jgi:hypothetical protein
MYVMNHVSGSTGTGSWTVDSSRAFFPLNRFKTSLGRYFLAPSFSFLSGCLSYVMKVTRLLHQEDGIPNLKAHIFHPTRPGMPCGLVLWSKQTDMPPWHQQVIQDLSLSLCWRETMDDESCGWAPGLNVFGP